MGEICEEAHRLASALVKTFKLTLLQIARYCISSLVLRKDPDFQATIMHSCTAVNCDQHVGQIFAQLCRHDGGSGIHFDQRSIGSDRIL